jgi:hypothetical protein
LSYFVNNLDRILTIYGDYANINQLNMRGVEMLAVSKLLDRALIAVIFVLLVALSAGLGASSRQNAGARPLAEDTDSGPTESFGSAGSSSFGSAPGGTSSFGSASSDSFGSAPTEKKKKGSTKTSKSTAMKKKTSGKKSTAKKSGKKTAARKQGHKKPTAPVVSEPKEQPKTTPKYEEPVTQPETQPEKEAPKETEVAGKGEAVTPAEELPTTGPGQMLGLFSGVSLAGFAGHKLYLRRKA